MLWHITITHRRTGAPSAPLVKRLVVVADDPHAAETLAMQEAGVTREQLIRSKIDACQSGVIRIR